MNLTLIYADDNANIEVDPALSYLQVTFLRHPTSEEFRKIKIISLNYALEQGLTIWLCDMQQVEYLHNDDQYWLVLEIFAALQTKSKHEIAYVINIDSLELRTPFRIHDIVKNTPELHKLLKLEIFFETEIARQWLFDPVKLL